MTQPRSPTVLMTGSSGLIGTAVARRLASDYTVIGLDIEDPPADSQLDVARYADLTSERSLRDTMEYVREHHGEHIAAVIHLAAYYDFTGERSPLYEKITIKGTEHLLCALDGFHVDRFLFTSTMLVHAPVKPGQRIREDSPLDPRWAYPESKLRTERLIRDRHGTMPLAFLRIAGVYTDYGRQPTLVQQIKRIHEQDFTSFFFPGDSSAGQSVVHVDDTADAIARTVDRRQDLEAEAVFLIGEPDPPGYAELQHAIGERVWGEEWPAIRLPESLAKAGAWIEEKTPGAEPFIRPFMIERADDHYALDIGRAQELLGWTPDHNVRKVLPGMIRMLKEDPAGWYERNGLDVPDNLHILTHAVPAGVADTPTAP